MNDTATFYEPLPEKVNPIGTGIPDLEATRLRRDGKLCLYERSDDVWEVFIIQTMEETIFNGVTYPPHELYPGNESFGNTAWCFMEKKRAEQRYQKLLATNKY